MIKSKEQMLKETHFTASILADVHLFALLGLADAIRSGRVGYRGIDVWGRVREAGQN